MKSLASNSCFREFDEEFSKDLIPRLREVFYFVKANAGREESGIRRLHLGYTAMREFAFDFIAKEFVWLEDFRVQMGLLKKINFLETNGADKTEFKPHIDGQPGNPSVMFNAPIENCTEESETYWVEPLVSAEPVLLCENGESSERLRGATPHLPPGAPFQIIARHSFINRCALFRSDIFHGVINRTHRQEPRIMMHWWYPEGFTWDNAVERNRKILINP